MPKPRGSGALRSERATRCLWRSTLCWSATSGKVSIDLRVDGGAKCHLALAHNKRRRILKTAKDLTVSQKSENNEPRRESADGRRSTRRANAVKHAITKERQTVKQILKSVDDVMILLARSARILALNEQAAIVLGTSVSQAPGTSIAELLPPQVRREVMSAIERAVSSGKSTTLLDRTILPGAVSLRCVPVVDTRGKTRRVILSAKDESFSSCRHDCLRAVALHAEDGFVIADLHGRIEYVNPAFEKLVGFDSRELIGRRVWAICRRRANRDMLRASTAQLKAGDAHCVEVDIVRRGKQPSRSAVTVSAVQARSSETGRVVYVIRKVPDYRAYPCSVRKESQMEVIGRLAAGVIHDMRNYLTVITGYHDLLSKRLSEDSANRGCLDEIGNAAKRAEQLGERILRLSHDGVSCQDQVALDRALGELVPSLLRLVDENIRLYLVTRDAEPCHIIADACRLEQAIMNLVINACDAMPAGGTLTITCDPSPRSASGAVIPGQILVTIEDTGCGMEEQTRDQALDDFFTTKLPGKGTGLVLPMVAEFMKECRGKMDIDSMPGCGTKVRLWFPSCSDACPVPEGEGGGEPVA